MTDASATTEADSALGRVRKVLLSQADHGLHVVFFTIHPSANLKLEVLAISKKTLRKANLVRPYKLIPHAAQRAYLEKVFQHVYLPLLSRLHSAYYFVYELDESNLMHIHGAIFDEDIQTDYDLQQFRQDIKCHPLTVQNMHKGSQKDWMNNIVYFDDADALADKLDNYFQKQQSIKLKHPDQFCITDCDNSLNL